MTPLKTMLERIWTHGHLRNALKPAAIYDTDIGSPLLLFETKEKVTMNEHTIREIARVSHEANRAYQDAALGVIIPEFDALDDDAMDAVVSDTREILENISSDPNWGTRTITKKVFVAVIKALAGSQNLV